MNPPSQPPTPPRPEPRSVGLVIAVLVVIIAVVSTSVVTSVVMGLYMEMRFAPPEQETVSIFKLTQNKSRGDSLSARDFELIQVPEAYARAFATDAVQESEEFSGQLAGGYDGRVFGTSARKGEVLRYNMFMQDSTDRLGLDLAPGRRLFSLPVNTENQPPNLSPDDFIDVYANVMRRTGTQAVLVMERVQIRLVGNRVVESGTGSAHRQRVTFGSVTIELAESEIPKLADLQSRVAGNQFLLVMRSPADRTTQLDEPGIVNPDVLELLGLAYAE